MYPKRFFIISFERKIVHILHKENQSPAEYDKVQLIHFKDIKECIRVKDESQKVLGQASKNFRFAFYLDTTYRTYELYTTSIEERDLWHSAFQFIGLSNKVDFNSILNGIKPKKREQTIEVTDTSEILSPK